MSNVVPLRGILAIEIVLGHTYGHTNNDQLLYFNDRIGVWVVGLFFFLSGYGLMLCLHRNRDYLKEFVFRKIGRILIPFLIVFLINSRLGMGNNLFRSLLGDWFVTEIMIVYLIWYIVYKYLPEKYAFAVLALLTFALNVGGCYYDIGSRWYGSTACFLVGISYEKYEEFIIEYLEKEYVRKAFSVIILFLAGGILFLVSEDNIVISAVMINITCVLLCVGIYVLLMKIKIGNFFTNMLGLISWEIYVIHRTFLYLYDKDISSDFGYMCLLFSSVILTSWLLHQICRIGKWLGNRYGKTFVGYNRY